MLDHTSGDHPTKPYRVCIVAPCGRGECTWMAAGLAACVAEFPDYRPYLYPGQGGENPNPPAAWRKWYISPDHHSFRAAASECGIVVFFSAADLKQVRVARSVSSRLVLVPMWHATRRQDRKLVNYFDTALAPHAACAERLAGHASFVDVLSAQWDQGAPLVGAKPGLNIVRSSTRFLVVIGNAVGDAAAAVSSAAGLLRTGGPSVEVTVSHTQRTWPAGVLREVTRLSLEFGLRFSLRLKLDYERYLAEMSRHDVVVLPSLRANSCAVTSEAAFLGKPVVAYDVSPISDMVQHGLNGRLVACELSSLGDDPPIAVGDTAALVASALWFVGQVDLRRFRLPEDILVSWRRSFRRLVLLALRGSN